MDTDWIILLPVFSLLGFVLAATRSPATKSAPKRDYPDEPASQLWGQ